MNEDLRGLVVRFEQAGLLRRIKKEVDPRHFATLAEQARGPLLLERVKGYTMPVVTNLCGNRRCLTEALRVADRDLGRRFMEAVEHPIPPVLVDTGPCKEVVYTGRDVDLTMLPLPVISSKDGGPYISGGVVITRDPEHGPNAGFYRMMYRAPDETNMGVLTHSDMYFYYQRAVEEQRPLQAAVAIGLPLTELLAASYQAPKNVDELWVAGGLRGEPVRLVPCETVDLAVPADAEIVLEGEIPPDGWVAEEGPFGEFTRSMGGVLKLPVFRVTAITTRRDPLYYSLHMPAENIWLLAPRVEGTAIRILREARIEALAANAPPGGSGSVLFISIRKRGPGEGKDAIHALLSMIRLLKYVVVVDEDVDVYDQEQVDWAIAFRYQPDRDTVIHRGARGAALDPSTESWKLQPGELATTAKVGIDATLPDRAPRDRFERLVPAFHEEVSLADYVG